MRRIRQIESGFGRALLVLGAYLLLTLVIGIVIGVANSNIFWGEANQYGRVPIPGRKKVDLPAGKVQVNVAAALPGRGNETPELLVPKLDLTLVPLHGEPEATIERDPGSSTNAMDGEVDTQRRIAFAHVAVAGTYLAVVEGDFTGYGVNAQIWFGREPSPIHGVTIWFVALAIAALAFALAAVLWWLRRRRRSGGGDGPEAPPTSAAERRRIEVDLHSEKEGVT